MKVGISTATFFSKVLTEDSFSVIQQCGGECAEVFLTTYTEYEPAFGDLLQARRDGLEIYSVHSLNTQFEPQLFNAAPRTRNDAEVFTARFWTRRANSAQSTTLSTELRVLKRPLSCRQKKWADE